MRRTDPLARSAAGASGGSPLARAARWEAAAERQVSLALWRRGWRPRLVPYVGYGAAGHGPGWVRVLMRVILAPPGSTDVAREGARGWRRLLTLSLHGTPVSVDVGDARHVVHSGHEGYVDVVLPCELPAGWHDVVLGVAGSPEVPARVRIVGQDERLGVVSDIDDTVMVTAIPRPLLAFWNSFVRRESTRRPVPGMRQLFGQVRADDPDAFVAYVTTGAWNFAPALRRFLARHGLPAGPLLMTDWGPTATGWFRSGREHKRAALRRLVRELPALTWVLVGDDGQHDPQLYDELAADAPDRVQLIAIRQLAPAEQLRTHGSPVPPDEAASRHPGVSRPDGVVRIHAPDGFALTELLRQANRR